MENIKIRDLDLYWAKGLEEETLERYDILGSIENIRDNSIGGISIECENGMLIMDKDGYEESFVTREDNPFIY